jgi:hypothetical protein
VISTRGLDDDVVELLRAVLEGEQCPHLGFRV